MHDYDGSTTINAPIAHVAAQFPGDVKAEWFGGMASCVDLDVIADQPTAVSQQPAGPFKVYEVSAHHVLQIRLSSVSGSTWPGRGSTPGGGIAPLCNICNTSPFCFLATPTHAPSGLPPAMLLQES